MREKLEQILAKYKIPLFELVELNSNSYALYTSLPASFEMQREVKDLFGGKLSVYFLELHQPSLPGLAPEANLINIVDHPPHYNSGKIEVIEAIEDWKLSFHLGNAVKYSARAGKKDPAKEVEDCEKAIWYLKRHIKLLKGKQEDREIGEPDKMPELSRNFAEIKGIWSEVELDDHTIVSSFIPSFPIKGIELARPNRIWVNLR